MLRQGLLPFLELVDSADPYSQLGLGILCCCFLSAGTTDNSEALSEMQVDSWDKDSTPDSYVSPSSLTGSSSQWTHPRQWRKIAKRDVDFFFQFSEEWQLKVCTNQRVMINWVLYLLVFSAALNKNASRWD